MTHSKTFRGSPAIQPSATRRHFLRQASALSLVAGAGAPLALNLLAAGSAAAQTASDYRAIVCLFMLGGNDAFNMVLPTDSASWQAYVATRGRSPTTIGLYEPGALPVASASPGSPARLGGVLPLTPTNAQGRSYALHPLMGSLQAMFNSDRRLAIVPNIGPLVAPTTKAQYGQPSHPRPSRLFSHNDQQSMWQTMLPEGATQGWGGRMADLLMSQNNRVEFTAISANGSAVWLSGQDVRQYQVSASGALRLGGESVFGSPQVASTLARVARSVHGSHVLEADVAEVSARSIDAEATLRSALPAPSDAAFGTPPATGASYSPASDPKLQYVNPLSSTGASEFNPLAQQLQVVARLVHAGLSGATGVKRQVFFVSLGGFDTHSGQNQTHATLMAKLAHALRYFDTALGAVGGRNAVTTFTASDFGRSFTSNGDGTDHGWGGHQFVMGGAVRGGELYGTFPTLVARSAGSNDFNSPDQVRNGAMLPTTSVDQLGATLGRWFGLSDAQALMAFPNLKNFDVAVRDLGFMVR